MKQKWIFPLHVLASFFMTGAMCFLHFVHYPLFRFIPYSQFYEFHNQHIVRYVPIVALMMSIELLTALYLFIKRSHYLWAVNFFLVICTWVLSGFWQGPMHTALARQYNPELLEFLIRTNIWRTSIWGIHSI